MSLLKVRGVTIRFGGVVANEDVTFGVEPGAITGLIGPNGAGKTTILNAISGLVEPAAGDIVFRGRSLRALLPYERAPLGIGRTYQDVRLVPSMSVRDTMLAAYHSRMTGGVLASTLRLPRIRRAERAARARADAVLAVVDLSRYLEMPCDGLSFGTLRMTELACLLMAEPTLLLLDEPASGIAQRETEALGPLLRRIRDVLGATILIVEHDMPLVMSLCDDLVCLDLGRVIARGTPAQIRADERVVAAYLGRRETAHA